MKDRTANRKESPTSSIAIHDARMRVGKGWQTIELKEVSPKGLKIVVGTQVATTESVHLALMLEGTSRGWVHLKAEVVCIRKDAGGFSVSLRHEKIFTEDGREIIADFLKRVIGRKDVDENAFRKRSRGWQYDFLREKDHSDPALPSLAGFRSPSAVFRQISEVAPPGKDGISSKSARATRHETMRGMGMVNPNVVELPTTEIQLELKLALNGEHTVGELFKSTTDGHRLYVRYMGKAAELWDSVVVGLQIPSKDSPRTFDVSGTVIRLLSHASNGEHGIVIRLFRSESDEDLDAWTRWVSEKGVSSETDDDMALLG